MSSERFSHGARRHRGRRDRRFRAHGTDGTERTSLAGRVQASLQRRVVTAKATYRTGGATGVILKVLLKLGYHRVIFYEELLHPVPPPFAARVPLEFEFLDRSSMDEIAAFRSDVPREQLEQRFDRDERCFVARFEGRVVCAFWMQAHDVQFPELGYALVVPPGSYHVGDGYTAPDMRGQRISPALIRELKIRLAAEGVERWVAYVLGGNVLGLINAKHIGSRETGRVAALKLGPLPPVRVPYFPRRKSS